MLQANREKQRNAVVERERISEGKSTGALSHFLTCSHNHRVAAALSRK